MRNFDMRYIGLNITIMCLLFKSAYTQDTLRNDSTFFQSKKLKSVHLEIKYSKTFISEFIDFEYREDQSLNDMRKTVFKNDTKLNAIYLTYYSSGNIEFQQRDSIQNNRTYTEEKRFYENGKIASKALLIDSKPIGSVFEYYESGSLKSEEKYHNGKIKESNSYYENGQRAEHLNYKTFLIIYASGNLDSKYHLFFLKPALHGKSKKFGSNGEVDSVSKYRRGKLIKTIKTTSKGREIEKCKKCTRYIFQNKFKG